LDDLEAINTPQAGNDIATAWNEFLVNAHPKKDINPSIVT
jgi:hypothetical protein